MLSLSRRANVSAAALQAADLQDAICNAATGDALVMVLHQGSQAGLLPQLSSQYLALSCQRLAHFEEEYPVATLDDFVPVMQHVQVRRHEPADP